MDLMFCCPDGEFAVASPDAQVLEEIRIKS